jgi:hypothetical protein
MICGNDSLLLSINGACENDQLLDYIPDDECHYEQHDQHILIILLLLLFFFVQVHRSNDLKVPQSVLK